MASEPTWRASWVRHVESDSPPSGNRPRVTISGTRYKGRPVACRNSCLLKQSADGVATSREDHRSPRSGCVRHLADGWARIVVQSYGHTFFRRMTWLALRKLSTK